MSKFQKQPAGIRFPRLGRVGFVLFVAMSVALSALNLAAQIAPARPGSSNRYLLIVDTSSPMQRRADAVLKAVQGLLVSGMNGQLRRSDTLGVWTFNEDLYSGQFPLQQWSPETAGAITARALTFLKGQKYAKQPRLDKVLPALNRVVADSDLITVILITAGTENIQGTSFDDKINETYRLWRAEQLKARMPFLTVLRARGGHITECSVHPAPWRVELPPLPPEPHVAEVAKPQPAPPP